MESLANVVLVDMYFFTIHMTLHKRRKRISLKSAKRAEVLSHVYIGKGLMPRVQQSLTSLARRVIPGLSSISRANAGIIFTRTPSDE